LGFSFKKVKLEDQKGPATTPAFTRASNHFFNTIKFEVLHDSYYPRQAHLVKYLRRVAVTIAKPEVIINVSDQVSKELNQ
jgi:hypothetical protein